jgi:hypothetical protein
MAIMPGADWKPVVNHSGSMAAEHGLVIHVCQGDNSLYGFFNNPASQVSSHFWAGKNGELEQYVDTGNAAWAEMAGNYQYISCECEGFDTEYMTDQQLDSLAHIFAWGHSVYGWPLVTCDHGGSGLTTHCHYPSGIADPAWGGHPCPGPLRLQQVPEVLSRAVALVGAHPVTPSPSHPVTKTPGVLKMGTAGVTAINHGQLPIINPTTSNDAYNWQYRMIQRGWGLKLDGNYGPASMNACMAMQQEFGLKVDGVIGPITWAATWMENIR